MDHKREHRTPPLARVMGVCRQQQTVSMPFDLMIVLPPTDTNPKNLELASPESVTATRLDQLVYSPNYYIKIFRLNHLPAVRIEPSTARSKLKSNVLTYCAVGAMSRDNGTCCSNSGLCMMYKLFDWHSYIRFCYIRTPAQLATATPNILNPSTT